MPFWKVYDLLYLIDFKMLVNGRYLLMIKIFYFLGNGDAEEDDSIHIFTGHSGNAEEVERRCALSLVSTLQYVHAKVKYNGIFKFLNLNFHWLHKILMNIWI